MIKCLAYRVSKFSCGNTHTCSLDEAKLRSGLFVQKQQEMPLSTCAIFSASESMNAYRCERDKNNSIAWFEFSRVSTGGENWY